MWTFEHSVKAKNIKSEAIWNIYQNVAGWPSWDSELDSASLVGDFTVGSEIMIKPKKGPKVKAVITECEPYVKFMDVTRLPLKTKITFIHDIEIQDKDIKLTHRINIDGPLTFIFKRLIGTPIAKHLPDAMKKLIQLSKSKEGNYAQ